MKKFDAGLRSILLAITLATSLVICVQHARVETTFDYLLALVLLGSSALYLLVSAISLVVRAISRARMDESDRMKDTFTGAFIYNKYGKLIDYFRRLSLAGTIMFIVNVVAFNVTSDMVIGGPYSSDIFLAGYHGFLLWSFIALLFSFVLSLIYFALYLPHYGEGTYNIFQYTGKLIVSDIIAPLRIIKSFFGSGKKKDWIGLITIAIFIVVNIIAILKST